MQLLVGMPNEGDLMENNQTTQDIVMQELIAERDKLRAENSKLKGDKGVGSVRVTPKGGVSVYGLSSYLCMI